MTKFFLVLSCLLLTACLQGQSGIKPGSEVGISLSPDQIAAQLFDDYFEDWLKLHPLRATSIGDKRYNDRLENFLSPDYRARTLALTERYLSRAAEVDPETLSEQSRLSFAIFLKRLNTDREAHTYPDHLLPINQFYNLTNKLARLGNGQGSQPFKTARDYENWLKRMAAIPPLLDQAIVNMKEGIALGIVQPRAMMIKVLPQISTHLVTEVTESVFFQPVQSFPEDFSEEDRTRLVKAYSSAIATFILPSYQKLYDFIRNQYLPQCRTTDGLGSLPGGQAWYGFKIRKMTGLDMNAEMIHQIGLEEVSRIHDEILAVMADLGYQGSRKEFFDFLVHDPQFIYASKEDLLGAYRVVQERCDALIPNLFEVFPKASYEVRPVEADREKSASAASYRRPAADGSRPGICYINTCDLPARPSWAVAPLLLHEALPGHHFQLAIQQELTDLPRFRRFGKETAFTEGWALYAEDLGMELGVYETPYAKCGVSMAELWRAIRLVVDTGLHAKGWSREQVIDYMLANAPVTESRAVAEVERYMAIPAQALAYKIGQLKIRDLRTRAENALGAGFDVRKFHTEILKDGAMPLSLLEKKINRWIDVQTVESTQRK